MSVIARLSSVVGVAVTLFLGVTIPLRAQNTNTYYQIVSRNTGKVLEVSTDPSNAGTVDQRTSNNGTNQQWYLVATDSGYFNIVSRASGEMLDVYGQSLSNGAVVQQWPSNGGANQQWQFVATDSGYFEVVNRNSGLVLDVDGVSTADGAGVQQWQYLGGLNQQWELTAVGTIDSSGSGGGSGGGGTGSGSSSGLVKEYIYFNGHVVAIENASSTESSTPPPATPPSVIIESPSSGASLSAGTTTFSGYVLDSSAAVSEVTVSIPGLPAQIATLASRPDVCSAHPGVQGCPNVGWSVTINTSSLQMQSYTATVTASDGLSSGTGSVPFSIVNPTRVHIDIPNAQSPSFLGLATFSGWALSDSSAIASVEVSINGQQPVPATYGVNSYACDNYPGRSGCPNVGWTLNVNTASYPNGTYPVVVTAKSTSGSEAVVSTQFSISNRPYEEGTYSLGEATLVASSNPVDSTSDYGTATLQYSGSPSNVTQIRVGSPEGQLLTSGEAGTGFGTTGNWITNGMVFFLQDADSWPLTINHTMAMLPVYVRKNGASITVACPSGQPNCYPTPIADGSGLTSLTLAYSAPAGVTNTTMTVGSNYQIFCGGGSSGTCPTTGKWVANGTQFFLHNTPNGSTPNASNVIASFTATVIDLGAPGFVLNVLPNTMHVGTPWFSTVEVDAENNFSNAVTLGASGVPAGVDVSFAPQNTLTPSAQTGLKVVAPLTTRWSYMTITGTSGSVQHVASFEIQNLPPQITSYNIGGYSSGTATVTVNATDAESDLSYVQINIAGSDNQGTCAAIVSLTAPPVTLPNADANGACSVVSSSPASGNGSSGSFTITFHFDSSRFYGGKSVTAFAVEQSTAVTSSSIGGINIPQNQ